MIRKVRPHLAEVQRKFRLRLAGQEPRQAAALKLWRADCLTVPHDCGDLLAGL
jgi:hypothetical protein